MRPDFGPPKLVTVTTMHPMAVSAGEYVSVGGDYRGVGSKLYAVRHVDHAGSRMVLYRLDPIRSLRVFLMRPVRRAQWHLRSARRRFEIWFDDRSWCR